MKPISAKSKLYDGKWKMKNGCDWIKMNDRSEKHKSQKESQKQMKIAYHPEKSKM